MPPNQTQENDDDNDEEEEEEGEGGDEGEGEGDGADDESEGEDMGDDDEEGEGGGDDDDDEEGEGSGDADDDDDDEGEGTEAEEGSGAGAGAGAGGRRKPKAEKAPAGREKLKGASVLVKANLKVTADGYPTKEVMDLLEGIFAGHKKLPVPTKEAKAWVLESVELGIPHAEDKGDDGILEDLKAIETLITGRKFKWTMEEAKKELGAYQRRMFIQFVVSAVEETDEAS